MSACVFEIRREDSLGRLVGKAEASDVFAARRHVTTTYPADVRRLQGCIGCSGGARNFKSGRGQRA